MPGIEYWMEHKDELRKNWDKLPKAVQDELHKKMGAAALKLAGIHLDPFKK